MTTLINNTKIPIVAPMTNQLIPLFSSMILTSADSLGIPILNSPLSPWRTRSSPSKPRNCLSSPTSVIDNDLDSLSLLMATYTDSPLYDLLNTLIPWSDPIISYSPYAKGRNSDRSDDFRVKNSFKSGSAILKSTIWWLSGTPSPYIGTSDP